MSVERTGGGRRLTLTVPQLRSSSRLAPRVTMPRWCQRPSSNSSNLPASASNSWICLWPLSAFQHLVSKSQYITSRLRRHEKGRFVTTLPGTYLCKASIIVRPNRRLAALWDGAALICRWRAPVASASLRGSSFPQLVQKRPIAHVQFDGSLPSIPPICFQNF